MRAEVSGLLLYTPLCRLRRHLPLRGGEIGLRERGVDHRHCAVQLILRNALKDCIRIAVRLTMLGCCAAVANLPP